MKLKILLLTLIAIFSLTSCSQDENKNEIKVTSSSLQLIPSRAISCLNQRNDLPLKDVAEDYFRVPSITFTRKDTKNDLIISSLNFNIEIPGSTAPFKQVVSGDDLAALSSTWFVGSKEAIIPAGQAQLTTDCALKLGGIKMTAGLTTSGILEVRGYERDTNGEEYPVRFSTVISIESIP